MPRQRRLIGAGAVLAIGGAVAALLLLSPAQDVHPPEARATAPSVIEAALAAADDDAFGRPAGPWRLKLPRDHGAHPEARSETWLIAAHLKDERGAEIGVQFSLARFGLTASARPDPSQPWRLRALHHAQISVTRAGAAAARAEERFSRGAGAAGHDAASRRLWLDDWRLTYGGGPNGDQLELRASIDDAPLRLTLTPAKPALAPEPGAAGQSAPARGFASPRLIARGEIGAGDAVRRVAGVAWLDRLWGEPPAPGGPLAYDRLIVHLDDGAEFSLLRSHRRGAEGIATVDGVIIDAAGVAEPVSDARVKMTPTAFWRPAGDGAAYPVAWRIVGAGLDLSVQALQPAPAGAFAAPIWSGTVRAEGARAGAAVSGLGTLQMTGYQDP